jgi:DNA-binding transcriptional ArsR family regulator
VKLRLSADDLGRVRVAGGPDPALELRFSLRMLREPATPCFGEWHADLLRRFDDRLGRLVAHYDQAAGRANPEERRLLAAYERVAIEPYWDRMETLIAADRVRRSRTVLEGGLDALLGTLHPEIRWTPPVLEIAGPGAEVELSGQGLLLQPAIFVGRSPVLVRRGDLPILLYPVSCELDDQEDEELGALIGRTRATLVRMLLAGGATTTQLARDAGLSMAAVSQHVGVLRAAGLAVTQAVGRSRCHTLTPAGVRLLDKPLCAH